MLGKIVNYQIGQPYGELEVPGFDQPVRFVEAELLTNHPYDMILPGQVVECNIDHRGDNWWAINPELLGIGEIKAIEAIAAVYFDEGGKRIFSESNYRSEYGDGIPFSWFVTSEFSGLTIYSEDKLEIQAFNFKTRLWEDRWEQVTLADDLAEKVSAIGPKGPWFMLQLTQHERVAEVVQGESILSRFVRREGTIHVYEPGVFLYEFVPETSLL